ncbi:MAG: chromosome segregation protein SMC [Pseudomonadota bacterium]
MKISRLDVLGFKSFIDRTTISFAEGIAAIIGPNGCGKSNLVDAIRWVLGEQSPRQLRGANMHDMIFNGNEKRAPFGMAEVTITLANGNGSAPPPFENLSEISVSRRLYRSGESEYLINKTPCRLKDVLYFFMDTGVGTKLYSIIDQSQIGWFIDAKPAERRPIIDEVAGISKFNFKRDEALRKIEGTRQNLLRIEDIMSEVKKQMTGLHRQAKKTERYIKLKQHLKALDLVLTSAEYAGWKDALIGSEKTLAEAAEKQEVASAGIKELELGIEKLGLEILSNEKDLDARKTEVNRIEKRIHEKSTQAEQLGHSLEETKTKILGIERETHHQERRIADVAAQKQKGGRDYDSLLDRMNERTDWLSEAERDLQRLRAGLNLLSDELEEAKVSLVDVLAKEADCRNRILSNDKALAKLVQRRKENRMGRDEILAALEKNRTETATKTSEKESLSKEIDGAGAALSLLQAREKADQENVSSLEKQIRELSDRYTEKAAKFNLLQSLNSKLEGLPAGTRALLSNGNNRSRGLLADFVETEPGFATAVETALGERLQSLIMENVDHAFEAITYLKTRQKGESIFLHLNGKQAQAGLPVAVENERLLADKVRVPEQYCPLVSPLLNETYWFKDLDEAQRFWKEQSGNCTAVTLDGDLIDKSGLIKGGCKKEDSTGFFSRKEELRELASALKELKSDIEQLKTRLNKAAGSLRTVKSQIETDEKNLRQREFDFRLKTRDIEELARTDSIYEKRSIVLERERAELDEEKELLKNELTELREILDEIAFQKSTQQNGIEEKAGEVETAKNELETRRNSVVEAKMELTALKEKIRHVALEEERLRREDERAKSRYAGLKADKERLLGEQGQIETRLRSIQGELALDREAWENETALLHADMPKYQEKKDLLVQIQVDLKAGQKELRDIGNGLNSIMVRKTEAQLNLRHLEEKVWEAYQVSLGDEYQNHAKNEMIPDESRAEMEKVKEDIATIGEVNLTAIQEYKELQERYTFLSDQHDDLVSSIDSLEQAIQKINRTSKERIQEALASVNEKLSYVFSTLFGGGIAELRLTDPANLLESGIDLYVQPPGKKLSSLSLLSSGEKTMATLALLFAIYMVKPSPFCLLDEVDAPLDQANSRRFNDVLRQISKDAQVILVTHNQSIMEAANTLYGVTMEEKGVSKQVSVRLN